MELVGKYVVLEPLGPQHAQGLVRAAAENRETFNWAPVPRTMADIELLLATREALQASGSWISFATCRSTDRPVRRW